jgi:DNA-binding response OmpR family regulator
MEEAAGYILVVDDEPMISQSLSDVLGMKGYAVRTAPSGGRALQIMETSQFDLIITDMKMAGMGGLDLVAKVREMSPNTSVVILSGYGDRETVIEAMRAGVADYITKPYSVNEVLLVVEREVKRARVRSHAIPSAASTLPDSTSTVVAARRTLSFAQRDLERIDSALSQLRAQANADAVLLIEDNGFVVAAKGMIADEDLQALAVLIAGGHTLLVRLAKLIEEESFGIVYFEAAQKTVYAVDLSRELSLVLVVPNDTRQGAVRLYVREAIAEIDPIAQGASVVQPAAPEATVSASPSAPAAPISSTAQQPSVSAAPRATSAPEPISWDEDFEETPTLSFEEAMKLGLVGNLDAGKDSE